MYERSQWVSLWKENNKWWSLLIRWAVHFEVWNVMKPRFHRVAINQTPKSTKWNLVFKRSLTLKVPLLPWVSWSHMHPSLFLLMGLELCCMEMEHIFPAWVSFFCESYLRTCLSGISLLTLANGCSIMYISRNMILLKLGATKQIYLASKVMKPINQ